MPSDGSHWIPVIVAGGQSPRHQLQRSPCELIGTCGSGGNSPEPPLGETPGADPLHAALQVEQSCDGLFQTLLVLLVLAALFQLL